MPSLLSSFMIPKLKGPLGRRVAAVLVAVSSLAALTVGAQQAVAAPEPPPIHDSGKIFKVKTAEEVAKFKLYPREMRDMDAGTNIGELIKAAEATGKVRPVSPLSVTQEPAPYGLAGRALCHTTGINGTFKYNGFCWNEDDDKTSAYKGGWHNQGFTASHDAYESGTVNGNHLYMATWYYGLSGTDRNKLARISILKSTGTSWQYGHVMLVRPTGTLENPNYAPVTDVHADGMVWYGNRLFVANGGELQVYDLNHLWRVNSPQDTNLDRPGLEGSASRGYGHQWVLPMIDRYSNRLKKDQDSASNKSNMFCSTDTCLSSLSLDRSVNPPQLLSSRWGDSFRTDPLEVVRWPLDKITQDSTATVYADAAYTAPLHQIQGVATDGEYYYMAAQCDTGYMGDPQTADGYSCIWQAKPNGPVSILTRAPSLTQNLSYSHASGRLWGMNEVEQHRVVFSLRPREADNYQYLYNDFSLLCAGVGSKLDNSTPVIQWGCNNTQDERWLFEDTKDNNGNPAYFIRNTYSGKCMGTGNSLANGAGMIQYTCNGAVDEKWWYNEITHELQNVYSGKCLGLGANASKGTQLIQWTCNGADDERWTKSRNAPIA